MESIRRLVAWQRAMDLVVEVYDLSRCFPRDELFGLTSQVRRSVISVPSNIAEGNERDTLGERRHFISTARGSLAEVDTQLEAAVRVGYLERKRLSNAAELIDHTSRMLTNLRRNLNGRP